MGRPLSERRRVREVRKYYRRQPDDVPIAGSNTAPSTIAATRIVSPNTTLTALMQLIAWRLGKQRAMVSVVDQSAQYFLAEATKTLDLEDNGHHEDGDALWMGCGGTVRSEALCANTIEVPRVPDSYGIFAVSDLSKDPKFRNLPYVAGGPHFRYYAGTPLLSKLGIPIGSVFVIDTRPHPPPTATETEFLGVMARNVMEYLEMKRGSDLRQRNETMSGGLAALVEGKSTIFPMLSDETPISLPEVAKSFAEEAGSLNLSLADRIIGSPLENSKRSLINVSQIDKSSGGEGPPSQIRTPLKTEDQEMTHDQIFSRASNLLRESLDADYTVFFDINVAVTAGHAAENGIDDLTATRDKPKSNNSSLQDSTTEVPSFYTTGNTAFPRRDSAFGNIGTREHNQQPLAQLLSFSTLKSSSLKGDDPARDYGFRAPEARPLRKLLKRYPSGRIWVFNEDGAESSSEEEAGNLSTSSSSSGTSPDRISRRNREMTLLLGCFPGARQVLFAPLWEAGKTNELAACFAVSLQEETILRSEKDIVFVNAFLNSVSIECSRSTISASNRQKGDFISSISHELRSPLHGVIASAELLAETRLDVRQREFCSTIETCGRVLLETISNVLNYTKINNLRKESRESKRSLIKHPKEIPRHSEQDDSRLNGLAQEEFASSVADLAKICEDSVNVVAAAFSHHNARSDLPSFRVHVQPDTPIPSDGAISYKSNPLSIILNIMPGNWNFVCLPGAIQRIVINLVGNSLKYTQSGSIVIDLKKELVETEASGQNQPNAIKEMVVLRIRDTGIGISSEFLKTKLFSPFSQESTLAPGTGLGLNMVKTLVHLQQGIIDIKSQVGKGTTVIVRLPLPKYKESSIPPPLIRVTSFGQTEQGSTGEDFEHLKQRHKFTLYGFRTESTILLRDAVKEYLVKWFGMSESANDEPARILIVNEDDLDEYLATIVDVRHAPQLIVTCHHTSQGHLFQRFSKSPIAAELLTMPFGPQKLSKVLSICLSALEKPEGMSGIPILNSDFSITNGISPIERSHSFVGTPSVLMHEPMWSNYHIQEPLTLQPKIIPAETKAVNSLTVLCVDDNPINLRLLKTYMEKLKYTEVVCAENGAVAFEMYRRRIEGFDLVFMDLSMPVCDGFDCISLIRSLEKMQLKVTAHGATPPVPALIVALTGLASQRDQDAAIEAGADYFVTKPLKFSALKELLIEWGFGTSTADVKKNVLSGSTA